MKFCGGRVKIETIDRRTGRVIDRIGPDDNMIIDVGVGQFWRRLVTNDGGHSLAFNSIAVGTDFGNPDDWSQFNPEPPNRNLTQDDQETIYFTPYANMSFELPVDNVIKVTGLIDGVEAMTQSFPSQHSAVFTSATLRFSNGIPFAYKRFPARYISRDVDIRIIWTITMQNARTFCGFSDPTDDGLTFVYFGEQVESVKLNTDGIQQSAYVNHSSNITSMDADLAGFLYSGDETGALLKQDSRKNIIWQNYQNDGYKITGIGHDLFGSVYVSAENGKIRKLTEYGAQLWSHDAESAFIRLSGVDSEQGTVFYDYSTFKLTKLSPSGFIAWEEDSAHTEEILDAHTSKAGNTATISSDEHLRLFNADGDLLWEVDLEQTPTKCRMDPTGSIVVGFASNQLRKYDLVGDQRWSVNTMSGWTEHIAVDNDGVSFVVTNDLKIHKVSSEGNIEWTYDDILAPVGAIAVNRN